MQATHQYRGLRGVWYIIFLVFVVVGIFAVINHVFNLQLFVHIMWMENTYLYILLAIFLSLSFIIFPANKSAPRDRVPWYDAALFLLSLGVCSYFASRGATITAAAWEFMAPTEAFVLAIVLWALVLEGARRAGGTAMFLVVLILSLYPLYAGHMPEMVSGFNLSFGEIARYHAMSIESILGIPMRVVGTLFFGFILMGVALVITGGGRFFINLAYALMGTFRGGPAKVAIFASGLFGSMSGSVVSNVVATGSMTIPAMKRIGYPPQYAGGIEACASTGGVLMPPVMGATAFVMASMLGVSYLQIAIAAAIPSILYYFSLFMQIDAYAARVGMKGLPQEEQPSVLQTLKDGWFYIIVLSLLMWLLIYLRREALAPFYATALLLLLANLRKDSRMNLDRIKELIISAGRTMAMLTAQLAAVGLIIGALTVTGMAMTFSSDLVQMAGGNTTLILVMGAVTCFILGMGMTVTAAYVFLAIVLAPALAAGGLNTLAVHLFIMYWGMLSYITPPVALGAYAGAAIAEASPMRTGLEAMRLGAVIYFLPFFFVLNPVLVLQEVTLMSFFTALGTTVVGILLIAAGLQGYLVSIGSLRDGTVGWLTRVPLVAGGILIGWPGLWTSIIGLCLALPIVIGYLIVNRRTTTYS
ncbi:TRAP transporter permease [Bacteroidota bacterium]